uniref:Uncharacterized protein n=1 Tax=Arundo donax TaxID=35708 RepID=A0A0A9A966_ARUDO
MLGHTFHQLKILMVGDPQDQKISLLNHTERTGQSQP